MKDKDKYPMNALKIDRIRTASLELFAVWYDLWRQHHGEGSNVEDTLTDLMAFSSPEATHLLGHDHDFFIIHPSVGDEASWWTLYVTTQNDPYNQLELPQITSMWQVFDTAPNPIFLNDGFDSPHWMHVPEER